MGRAARCPARARPARRLISPARPATKPGPAQPPCPSGPGRASPSEPKPGPARTGKKFFFFLMVNVRPGRPGPVGPNRPGPV
ncbi:hypothetical protein M6B38_306945 [Iris pallida]|uniref:Uncharacterized protein n=1 Tax=Iris pallida TaxID=29817 RepID=A0AAX6HKR9_IRIPA|nr:hypothetical protein M6B38_309215 [Iris pallida]KAJ6841338.1 hypothetical protein M6B38_306945 [Iris pallida]